MGRDKVVSDICKDCPFMLGLARVRVTEQQVTAIIHCALDVCANNIQAADPTVPEMIGTGSLVELNANYNRDGIRIH
jgi:hypothetical protein